MTCTLSPSQPLHSVRGVNFKTHQTQSESHFLLGNSAICFARLLLVSETALTLNEPARAQHQCQISEEKRRQFSSWWRWTNTSEITSETRTYSNISDEKGLWD